ncbi:MAG: ABC transporter permease, partial [Betaproteobacteria bacterium]|nr:ABC transporter permease [Betaproteobacteria bacterium]
AGRQLGEHDAFGVVVGAGVAKALKLAPGDRVTLVLNTAEGALNSLDLEIIGVFESFSKDFDARAIRIPVRAAQEALGSTGVTALVLSLTRTEDTQMVAASLAASLDSTQLELRTWQQLNDFHEKTVALYNRQFGFVQTIILAMVLLSVANSVNMSVFERTGEFGTMRSLGNRSRQVVGLVLTESAILRVFWRHTGCRTRGDASVGHFAVGIPMPPPPNANLGYTAAIRIVPAVLAMALFVGLAATTLAGVLPAWRVSRMPIVDALRANV